MPLTHLALLTDTEYEHGKVLAREDKDAEQRLVLDQLRPTPSVSRSAPESG